MFQAIVQKLYIYYGRSCRSYDCLIEKFFNYFYHNRKKYIQVLSILYNSFEKNLLCFDNNSKIAKQETAQICTRTLLHEGSNTHQGTLLHEDIFTLSVTFARRFIFARE